jgi:hypothetical protein
MKKMKRMLMREGREQKSDTCTFLPLTVSPATDSSREDLPCALSQGVVVQKGHAIERTRDIMYISTHTVSTSIKNKE